MAAKTRYIVITTAAGTIYFMVTMAARTGYIKVTMAVGTRYIVGRIYITVTMEHIYTFFYNISYLSICQKTFHVII
jgi:hypothetical protein